ncbi:hypothetical protein [Akkermansia massiliensis]
MKAGGIIKAASFYGPAEREPSSAVEGKKKQPSACRIQQPPALLPGSPKKAFRSLRRQRKIRTTFCLHLPRLPADIFLLLAIYIDHNAGGGWRDFPGNFIHRQFIMSGRLLSFAFSIPEAGLHPEATGSCGSLNGKDGPMFGHETRSTPSRTELLNRNFCSC